MCVKDADLGDLYVWNVISYPNPAKDVVDFNFYLNKPASVSITVYTLTGRVVAKIESEGVPSANSVTWHCGDTGLANGIYIYKLSAQAGTESMFRVNKMVIMQ